MRQSFLIGVLALLSACMAANANANANAAGLSADEGRWLRGIEPVLAFARASHLPLRVIVQPQPTPGLTPLGMAFEQGRCTLVLSMRGNPLVEALEQRVEPDLLDATLELMAAHELGHCQRHLQGVFGVGPAGFEASRPGAPELPMPAPDLDIAAVQREEAYADIVGLAWIRQRHAALYNRLHGWLMADRSADEVRDSEHDTTAWLRLLADGDQLSDPSIFVQATRIWARTARPSETPHR